MARSAVKTTKIPTPILDALELLRKVGGPFAGYSSANALHVGLMRYAIAFPREHKLTAAIANLSPGDQDAIDDYLLALAKDGKHLADISSKPTTVEELLRLAKGRP